MNKIAFIGCGNMGEALIRGLLDKNLFSRKDILVSDIRTGRLRYIEDTYRVNIASSNMEAVRRSDIIILAVKPQDIGSVLQELDSVVKNKLIISIAAGITIDYIKKRTEAKRIVRAMPNIPALIGSGITAVSFTKGAKTSDIKIADKIFNCTGEIVHLEERYINAVTAVSGSGPAYFFLLMEAMVGAALNLGISKPIAEKLVSQTALGASLLQHKMAIAPAILCKRVTSKGGTTEAALKVFKRKGFERMVGLAISAANKRAKELSDIMVRT